MSAQDLCAPVHGTEYVLRAGAPVAVYRASAREDGSGWLCRDADGSGPLRTYAGRDIHGTAAAALSGRSAYESTSRAIRGRVSGRAARQISLTAEQWAKIDRLAAAHGGRPGALGAMIDAYDILPALDTPLSEVRGMVAFYTRHRGAVQRTPAGLVVTLPADFPAEREAALLAACAVSTRDLVTLTRQP